MAQTERDQATVRTLLADNVAGDISPVDLRDALASLMGYGSMVLTTSGQPATLNSVSTTPVLIDVYDSITAQSIDVNNSGITATLAPDYAFTIGSTGVYKVTFWTSFSSSGNNELVTFYPFVDDIQGLVESDRWISTVGDTGSTGFSYIASHTAGGVIDIRVKLDSGTSNLTFLGAGFNIFRVG